ncbi:TBC1 domain family member 13 [Nosema granulosis]|uniref:TBC1 domain family member 13 n=1 Tax=Nosema granulosis TaxID=83296 RepID=A0A9P6GYY0_9MICR|nr:TBC1 domain family member 13 [Nosema granulosis]
MVQLIRDEKERRMDIDRIMSKQIDPNDFTPMNIHELRNYCYYGFSSKKHRPKYWKVLLGYFSKNKFNSNNYYREKRKAYVEYLKGIEEHGAEHAGIFAVIHDDLARTVIFPIVEEESSRTCSFLDASAVNSELSNRRVLERILQCFVVHNKSVGYLQGMHMLLIHIYYVMLKSEDPEDVHYSEEDSFFCFVSYISEIFEQIISNVEQGGESMQVVLTKIYDIIETVDPGLYKACKDKNLFDSGICIKWIMFAFSSEFKAEDVIWLWDRLLSDKNRFEMIFYCAAAIFVIMKDVICTEEIDSCLEVLQKPSLVDVQIIFNTADAMRLKVTSTSPLSRSPLSMSSKEFLNDSTSNKSKDTSNEESSSTSSVKENSLSDQKQTPIMNNGGSNEQVKSSPVANEDKQSPPVANEDKQSSSVANEDKQSPPVANEDKQSPSIANEDKQSPSVANEDKQSPPVANEDKQSPSAANEDKQSSSVANEDKQSPPVANEEELQDNHKNSQSTATGSDKI